ncbi:MAG: ornithine carbamoyltransferase [Candidatus Omnitrophota bacterium]
MKKNLVDTNMYTTAGLLELYALTDQLKKNPKKYAKSLLGKSIGLVFQKPSNRTRVSFEVGIHQLGGYSIYLSPYDIRLGKRESIKDVALVLSRYLDCIVARTFLHEDVLELAKYATIPVVNGLSNLYHPCQALADVYTIYEKFKRTQGINLSFIGDGNNVLHSLLNVCPKVGINLNIATPKGYEPDQGVYKQAKLTARNNKTQISLSHDAQKAIKDADIVYTDVWTSMGQEEESNKRKRHFKKFQINTELLRFAGNKCLVMHCLPAHRGEEITDEIMDSKNSIIYDQAENRLHVQKAILLKLMGD